MGALIAIFLSTLRVGQFQINSFSESGQVLKVTSHTKKKNEEVHILQQEEQNSMKSTTEKHIYNYILQRIDLFVYILVFIE